MRLIQLIGPEGRRTGIVEEPFIRLFLGTQSVYDLAQLCLRDGIDMDAAVERALSAERIAYEPAYEATGEWRIGVPIQHPADPARCLVSGTGLTHKASATNRDAMHAAQQTAATDSSRMYALGLEGGRPKPGCLGVSPEWFYKGPGSILRAHGEPLTIPDHAEDGGEEPEIAGVYIIDPDGMPRRIGMVIGNEFSDHLFERRNYLYLASSKLRECSIGPELLIGGSFQHVKGHASIERDGKVIWSRDIETGEDVMCHSLANIEHHHFKFDAHRRPGDIHIHYYGADAFSFGDGVLLNDGDNMTVRFDGFGRPLRNTVRRITRSVVPVEACEL